MLDGVAMLSAFLSRTDEAEVAVLPWYSDDGQADVTQLLDAPGSIDILGRP